MPAGAAAPPAELVVRDRTLFFDGQAVRCAVGFRGVRSDKREGDGATPAGVFPLRSVLYRPDREAPPATALPVRPLRPDDGWCDDPSDPAYNRPVRLPFPAHHEAMWRADGLYDLVVPLGANDAPPVPGRGSAIFLHLARPDWGPTEGCVAVERAALLSILRRCGPRARIAILA